MGFFSDAIKVTKDVATNFGGKVLDVAREIKDTAVEVVDTIRDKGGEVFSSAYGKVKSFGSMMLDRVFPNADTEEIKSLQSVTSSAKEAGGTEFVQAFSGSLKSAVPSEGTTSITQSFRESLGEISTDIKESIQNTYDNTIEAIFGKGTKKPKATIRTATATGEIKKLPSTFKTQDDLARKALEANPEFVKMANFEGRSATDLIKEQASFIGKDIDVPGMTVEDNPEFIKMANYSSFNTDANPELRSLVSSQTPQSLVNEQKSFLQQREGLKRLAGIKDNKTGSLLNSALDWAKDNKGFLADSIGAGFSTFGELQAESGYTPTSGGRTPSMISAQRGGVGGEGSSGGTLLSAAQKAFFNQHASHLRRLG